MPRIMRKTYPVVPLRNLTVLPGMILHFDLNREPSIKAVERAMLKDQKLFLVLQLRSSDNEPAFEDLYTMGTVAIIKQVVKLPKGIVRVLVEGAYRAELVSATREDCLIGVTRACPNENDMDEAELTAMVRELRDQLTTYVTLNPRIAKSLEKQFKEAATLDDLLDCIAINVPMSVPDRQKLLEAVNVRDRFALLTTYFAKETRVLEIKKDIQEQVKERVDKNQKEYILREQLKAIKQELGEDERSDADQYKKRAEELEASSEVKEKIIKEIDRFSQMGSYSSETAVLRGYIETMLELPWDKESIDNQDLKHARKVLDEDHYGLEKVKERMIEFLAVRNLLAARGAAGEGERVTGDVSRVTLSEQVLTKACSARVTRDTSPVTSAENCPTSVTRDTSPVTRISPIICLVGPPGTGKTSIAKSVARALDRKYIRISLGGVRDEAEIRGHRKTYVGAMPGRIAVGLKNAGVKNPLMLLDEIDKMSSDYKGDTASALLEVLDSEENSHFMDHYVEIPLDLSQVLFIATANSASDIPRPLLDRMEIIEVTSYTENEKVHIAKEHLLKKQIDRHGLLPSQLNITGKALERIVRGYTREAGVRNLERKLGEICRKAAKRIIQDNEKTVRVTVKNLEDFLGKERYSYDSANENDDVGIVRGLAWTSVGGDTLQIEVNVMPGKGEIILTGQLGDVMKESAQAGLSYIRSIGPEHGLEADYFKDHDFHIHIPQGSVPKDGPSAGITMATALYSAVTGRKVKASVAMTGEITLRGRVLPIGGLKEKTLAAKNAGIKTVLVPKKNERDIEEISEEILNGLRIVYVETMEDVLREALV